MLAVPKCKVKMSASEKKKVNKDNSYDTSSIKRETSCNQEVSESVTLQSCKTTAKKCTKKVCCTCKVAFLLIRLILTIVFHRSSLLCRLPLITLFFLFCLSKLFSRYSLFALAKSIYPANSFTCQKVGLFWRWSHQRQLAAKRMGRRKASLQTGYLFF